MWFLFIRFRSGCKCCLSFTGHVYKEDNEYK